MDPKPTRGSMAEFLVEALDARGRGLARIGEYLLRVRGAIPGDRILARIQRVRHGRREAEARIDRLLVPGVARCSAKCSHFGLCGGCLWQDLPYDEQLRLKQEMVEGCLQRTGLGLELGSPIAADVPFGYRNKMEFSFAESRDGTLDLGLHVGGRFDQVFDLESCHLQSEGSNRIVEWVRNFAREAGLSVYHLRRHEGLLRFLTIREGKRSGEVMVVVTTSGEAFAGAADLGRGLVDAFPEVKSVIHSVNRRKAQVAIGDEEIVIAGSGTVHEELGAYRFEISPSSFFQTNTLQAERLYELVADLADPVPGDRVLDVYCGTGGISIYLSSKASEVIGVEVVEPAVSDASRNSANNGIGNCRFIAGSAEDALRQLKDQGERFDTAIADPPRPGMHPKALQALVDLDPKRIIYVSCNPEALGSDLKDLEAAGYRSDHIQLVDMFPHTPHCEVVARVVKRG